MTVRSRIMRLGETKGQRGGREGQTTQSCKKGRKEKTKPDVREGDSTPAPAATAPPVFRTMSAC